MKMKRNLFSKFTIIPTKKKTHKPPLLAPTDEALDRLAEKKEMTTEELLAELVDGQEAEDEIFEKKCQKTFNRVFNTVEWKISFLIKSECSFYFPTNSNKAIKHYCPLRETEAGSISMQCIYLEKSDEADGLEKIIKLYKSSSFDNTSINGARCEHFEKSVLPAATELEVAYRTKRKLRVSNYFLRCKRCNKHFVSSQPRRKLFPKSQLCDKCKALALVG